VISWLFSKALRSWLLLLCMAEPLVPLATAAILNPSPKTAADNQTNNILFMGTPSFSMEMEVLPRHSLPMFYE
jgi:hypothetical protein